MLECVLLSLLKISELISANTKYTCLSWNVLNETKANTETLYLYRCFVGIKIGLETTLVFPDRKIKSSVCLIKYHAMKSYGGMDVQFLVY
jgi:hypothetical protein